MNTSSINIHRFWRGVAAAIALLCIVSGDLFAQNTTGTIRGTVTGAGGAPIGSAQIIAQNTSSGGQRTAQTNDAGFYTLVGLVPGTYDVTVRRIGNAPQTRTIVVQIGATQVQDFALATQAAQLQTQVITASTGQEASRGNPFPRNAVDQYRVIAQNFKAEYQKASSAVITATTKSGGNVWSGNALVGYQNKSMVAEDSFQRANK